MKIIPYERYSVFTNLSEQEIFSRLFKELAPSGELKPFSFIKPRQPYYGSIENDRFRIRRIIQGRNAWLPVITGTVTGCKNGSVVHVRMRIAWEVLIFTVAWLVFVFGVMCRFIYQAVNQNEFNWGIVFVLGMFSGVYCLMLFSFKAEARKTRKFLDALLLRNFDQQQCAG